MWLCSAFINAVFLWNFFFGLFVLWTVFLYRIRAREADTSTKKVDRLHCLPYGLFYVCGLIFSAAFAIIQLNEHPVITYE